MEVLFVFVCHAPKAKGSTHRESTTRIARTDLADGAAVEMTAVHALLHQYKDSSSAAMMMEFLTMVAPLAAGTSKSRSDTSCSFQGGTYAGNDFVSTTHVTMAHFERTSHATMQELYGGLLGARVELKVTALLWSTRVAALAVDIPEQTPNGKQIPKSQNPFSHMMIWFHGTSTTAFEANRLPDLVTSGEAQRLDFENPIPLPGKISFWGKDNKPLRNA